MTDKELLDAYRWFTPRLVAALFASLGTGLREADLARLVDVAAGRWRLNPPTDHEDILHTARQLCALYIATRPVE